MTRLRRRQQPAWDASGDIQTFHVQGNVRLLVGAGGNIAVQTGPEGVLFVDSGLAAHAEKMLAAIRKRVATRRSAGW